VKEIMSKKLVKSVLSAALLVAAGVATVAPGTASAASAPLSDPSIALHFDLAAGQTPENVAETPSGAFDVTFAKAHQVVQISPSGHITVLATLPAPADGGVHTPALGFAIAAGIVRAPDGTLYFLYAAGSADLTGVWRLRPGGKPERIAALPADGLPNGLVLDQASGKLYVADSVLGTIWQVPTSGGTAVAWSTAPELAATSHFLGANGLKLHNGALWVTNLDQGTVLRIPIQCNGTAGTVRTVASGMVGIDDFVFTGRGDEILTAMIVPNEVAPVEPDGTHRIVLTAADGIEGPTPIALRGNKVYVFSTAYQTNNDPNMIVANWSC
jgi:hypothetical protein